MERLVGPLHCRRTRRRSDWRAHGGGGARACAPAPSAAPGRATEVRVRDGVGRTLHTTRAVERGAVIIREEPIVRGVCTTNACPGCGAGYLQCDRLCRWAAAEAAGQYANARAWLAHESSRAMEMAPDERANHVRLCCLLAITIQAAASPHDLWRWLRTELRPAGPENAELERHTVEFARAFSRVLAPAALPPPSDAQASARSARERWEDELAELLARLQTNLFYVNSTCIGIFPSAWLAEHSCAPNAELHTATVETTAATRVPPMLLVTARCSIRPGDPISFSYLGTNDGAVHDDDDPLAQSVGARRERILHQLGFVCRCTRCVVGMRDAARGDGARDELRRHGLQSV